jgi:hypothetical protein
LLSIERVRDGVKVEALDESCIKDCFQDYMCHPVFSTKEFDSGVHIQEFRSCRSSGVAGGTCLRDGIMKTD